MSKLQIHLLGRFSASVDRSLLSISPIQAHLLAVLAMRLGGNVRRFRVAGLLWPELPDERARANLSNVVWRLRSTLTDAGLDGDVVQTAGDSVALDSSCVECDVEQFSRHASALGLKEGSVESLSDAVQAVGLYKGDLLEEWDVDWCAAERAALRERYLDLMQDIAEGFERRGRLDLAIHYAKGAVMAEPLNEAMQRRLIRLYWTIGDRAAALGQFRRFSGVVKLDLGVEPDRDTIALVGQVMRGHPQIGDARWPSSSGISRHDQVRLVGRHVERHAISSVLDAALAGRGGSVALWGEAGLGKSRLADWALEEWASKGGAIAKGRCLEFNEPVPYQPLLDALSRHISAEELGAFLDRDNARAALVSDFSGGAEASAIDQSGRDVGRLRLLSWLRARLQAITQRQPLLLALEDLQWADSGTIDFVTYVLEHAPRMRLAVLLTSRLSSTRQAHESQVRRLARAATLVCTLKPLDESDTAGLVELLVGQPVSSKKLLSLIYRETEGHPLFIVETIRLLQQREVAGGPGAQSSSPRPLAPEHLMPSIPHGVRATIEHRLGLLPSDPSKVVDLASVVGRVLEVDVLRAMTRMSENRLSRAVAELVRAGVLEREGPKLRFAHDKIREICYERLPARARRAYHAKCADLLAESPEATAHALAWHQQSSGQWHLATESWTHAGDHARGVRAYHDSRRAYEGALACLKQDRTLPADSRVELEFDLLSRVEHILAIIGSAADRRGVLTRMGELMTHGSLRERESSWLVRRAVLEDYLGKYALAANLARRGALMARESLDSTGYVAALRTLAWTLNRGGRSARSVAISQLALRKLGANVSSMKAAILGEASLAYIKLGEYKTAREHIQQAKECIALLGYADDDPWVRMTSAMVLKWTGVLGQAREEATKSALSYHRDGDAVAEARAVFQLATLDALEGNLADSLRHLRQAKSVLRTAGYLRIYAACLNEVAHGIGRQLGNYDWAWHASRLALNLPQEHRNPYTTAIYLDSQAQLLLDQNRVDEAAETMRTVFDLLAQGPASTMQHLESQARRGAVLFRQGRHSEAIVDLETAAAAQTRSGAIIFLPTTLSYLALARGEIGDRDGAFEASNEAVRILEQINLANHQPQQIFWHHFLVLAKFDQEPRLQFLVRAVELIERQAGTLSPAQGRRFRRDVWLNREILEAWAASGLAAAGDPAQAGGEPVEAPTRDVA